MASTRDRQTLKRFTGRFAENNKQTFPKSSSTEDLRAAASQLQIFPSAGLPKKKFFTPFSLQGLLICLLEIQSIDAKHSPLNNFFDRLTIIFHKHENKFYLKEDAADLLIDAKIQNVHLNKLKNLLTQPAFIELAKQKGFEFEPEQPDSSFNKLLAKLESYLVDDYQSDSPNETPTKSKPNPPAGETQKSIVLIKPTKPIFKPQQLRTPLKQSETSDSKHSLELSALAKPIYTMDDLDEEIRSLNNEKKDYAEPLIQVLLELRRDLDLCFKTQQANRKSIFNEQQFLFETIDLLKQTKSISQQVEETCRNENLVLEDNQADLTRYIQLVAQAYADQTVALLNYEKNCKKVTSLTNYRLKLIACIAITSFFALAGCAAGGIVGFIAGGGVLSTFTGLAGMTKGTTTGAAIGAFLGSLVTGLPAFGISQHFLFAPTALKLHENKIVAEAQAMFTAEQILKRSLVDSPMRSPATLR